MRIRARAMSTLGGIFRIGSFIGPFVGAIIVLRIDIASAYVFAAAMSLAAAGLAALLPDLPSPAGAPQRRRRRTRAGHRLLRPGPSTAACCSPSAPASWCCRRRGRPGRRSCRCGRESQGIDAATTSVIFGISAGVDMLLFYPGGAIMDRYGRAAVAVPAMITLGVGFVLLPLTHTALTVGLVACLMGLGNGISSGVVLTLGADAAPVQGRAQFLGGWRLCADLGNALRTAGHRGHQRRSPPSAWPPW